MKKIIGIFSIGILAIAMFINTNSVNTTTDLASLIAINTANAELVVDPDGDLCSKEPDKICRVVHTWITINGQHPRHDYPNCEPDTWYTFSDCL